MNRKTIIHLIGHILICISGMFAGILGFAEMFGSALTEIAKLPFHLALVTFISGIFTFVVAFTHGVDHNTWRKLKDSNED